MNINYPQTIIEKSTGVNASEAYLSKLCEETFLTLWSYPNVFRDQGRTKAIDGSKRGDGKELCDLLSVFDNHVFIFSDKECSFPTNGNIETNWARWFKRAVKEASDQIFGAERWLFEFPNSIFLDKQCKFSIPLSIPKKNESIVHRIVIAHGASQICREHFQGGTGSLMLNNQITETQHYDNSNSNIKPFQIGQICPKKGFVHVFDDVTLGIIMQSLDTVSDFSEYLTKKELFLTSSKQISVAGEEDLLAYYLKSANEKGDKGFTLGYDQSDYDCIIISQGCWLDFSTSSMRLKQIEAYKTSYFWDAIVEKFLYHIVTGTSDYMSDPNIKTQESIFRFLARENRMNRRILSSTLLDFMYQSESDSVGTRVVMPINPLSPAYLFFLIPYDKSFESYDQYREIRRTLLSQHLYVLKKQFPDLKDIIGIATETKDQDHSEDIAYLDATKWSSEDNEAACEFENAMLDAGLLNIRNVNHWKSKGFVSDVIAFGKGNARNLLCPCGSGKKFKKCCGRQPT